MELTSVTDADLVVACRSGNQSAWEEMVERFSRYVYAIAVRVYALPEADAEDVFQEVFTRAYERLSELRDDAALKPWLAQLTRRLCVDRLRATAREAPVERVPEPDPPEDQMARLDEALTVRDALEELPENCREIVDRFFACDQSYRTISEALELPQGTIASRISRCLAKLRTELDGR